MAFTEVTSEGWFSRIISSIGGVLVGIVLVLVACGMLFWNEGRSVQRAQTLAEGKGGCIDISADKVEASHEGKLVHLSGNATTTETLTDPLGVKADPGALVLRRKVEMYQWKENKESKKRKKLGGGEETVTTYTYEKAWEDTLLDSSDYKEKGHTNPSSMPYEAEVEVAQNATLGAFKLPADMVDKLSSSDKVTPTTAPKGLKIEGSELYKGANPSSPAIGDVKINFTEVKSGPYSLVAQQVGNSFQTYTTKNGGTILKLEAGTKSKDEMFSEMASENNMMTWILRVVGFFLIFIGINMVFRPFEVMLDVIPFLGDLMGFGVGLFSFLLAIPLTIVPIALGWIFYRPLVGILLLAGAVGIVVMAAKAGKGRRG